MPELTPAITTNGLVIYGVDPVTGADFQIPQAVFEKVAAEAKTLASQAKSTADTAKAAADTANNALPLKAAHGYGELPQKTLKGRDSEIHHFRQSSARI